MTPCLMKTAVQGAFNPFFLRVYFSPLWQLIYAVQVLSFHGTIITLKVITALITLFKKKKEKKNLSA